MTSDEYQDLRTWLSNLSESDGERVAEACLGKPNAKFERFDDAVAARKAAEIQLGYHENHGR